MPFLLPNQQRQSTEGNQSKRQICSELSVNILQKYSKHGMKLAKMQWKLDIIIAHCHICHLLIFENLTKFSPWTAVFTMQHLQLTKFL